MPDVLARLKRSAKRAKSAFRRWLQRSKSRREIFQSIYAGRRWGGADAGKPFFSGSGSHINAITDPYVEAVRVFIRERWAGRPPKVIDLGCGDYSIGQRLADSCGQYVGVDIVPELIDRNQREFGNPKTAFVCLDIVVDDLPSGDLCLIRQVLQHLSNDEISAVLPKLEQYSEVLITEHVPSPSLARSRNRDKAPGADIRLYWGSGIYLEAPPFSIPADRVRDFLNVPGHAIEPEGDPGMIKTVRIAT